VHHDIPSTYHAAEKDRARGAVRAHHGFVVPAPRARWRKYAVGGSSVVLGNESQGHGQGPPIGSSLMVVTTE